MDPEFADGAVCMPNIGPAQRAMRMRFGLIGGVVTVATAVALVVLGAPRASRLVVFVPAIMAAYGVLQAREKT